jgi:hypothetical protein
MALPTVDNLADRLFETALGRADQHAVKLRPGARHELKKLARTAAQNVRSEAKKKPPDAQEAYIRAAMRIASEGMKAIIDEMNIARIKIPDYLTARPDSIGETTLAVAMKILCPLWPFC